MDYDWQEEPKYSEQNILNCPAQLPHILPTEYTRAYKTNLHTYSTVLSLAGQ
jgi:hypothetical protein